MATQTAQNPPFARFRGGFGFSSRAREGKGKSGNDEDWYIPYNGPYEAPREPVRRPKARDSWGDPVEDYDEDDSMLADRELHLRYGGHNDFNTRSSGGRPVEEERKGRSRDRTFSVISGRTTSSGAVDPNRASLATHRRSTVSSGNPPPMPSYISLDAVGGVGESPMPPVRSKDASRISFASIFSFGGRAASVLSLERNRSGRKSTGPSRSNTAEKEGPYGRLESPTPPRQSSSSESRRPLDVNDSKILRQADKVSLIATDEDDYYNSYYSTLLNKTDDGKRHLQQPFNQPRSPSSSGGSHNSLQPGSRENAGMSRQNSTSTSSGHPYAYVFPQTEISEPPRTAPLIPTPHITLSSGLPNHPPRLTFTTPVPAQGPSSADAVHSAFSPRSAGVKSLKNSASTPNLRNQTMAVAGVNNATNFTFPKGKDRWLSAETWCDALLFPRPRLKLKHDPMEGTIMESSGRIVSPPGTPHAEDFGMQQQQHQREQGIASRVLAHSRSLVDLNKGRIKTQDIQHPHASTSNDPQTSRAGAQTLRPPRPKSFAQDDLALPTPTPSLAHVLREGQLLDIERRGWQMQAASSFGNKRARSLSRTRSKSLTQKGRQGKHQHQSSIEYIAARACLGAQPLTPTIAPPKLNMSFSDGNTTTTSSGRMSHSHNNSLVKSLTKSSKSHSQSHSRNNSWSKSAMKMAKSTVICGYPTTESTTSLNGGKSRAPDLEGALKGNETRVIRLADPAHLPVDRGQPVHPKPNQYIAQRHTPSPADSRLSDSKVGIALGTPPEEDSDYIPNHPYAQGGLSFSNAPAPSVEHQRHVDYAGPHPSINPGLKAPPISEIIARHKLPPHMVLHPYAQPAARDSYLDANGLVGQFRSEDGTPNPSKMWAQLSPGVLREILPGDLQYSPLMPESAPNSAQDRQTIIINDIVGLGEALVDAEVRAAQHQHQQQQQQAMQISHDQPQEFKDLDLPEFGTSSRRHGVQFDLSQPMDLEELKQPSEISTNASSSHLDFMPVPPVDRAQSISPAATSDSSPQRSPPLLGSPNDLESFQDLFYRPAANFVGRTPTEAALPETPSPPNRSSTPWDLNMPNRRTGSSLTSLARQLNEEFEQIALERRSSSQHSQSPTSSYRHTGPTKRPADGALQFVFEEVPRSESPVHESLTPPIHAFKPSETLPEDIQASRASSYIENADEDDPTAVFRVGMVESVSTPPTVSSDHHLSFEQTAFIHNRQEKPKEAENVQPDERIVSGLQPPTEATRSSYMTTSTASRMSGLSDFPAPPKDDYIPPKHMSVLSSYFDEVLTQSESRSHPPPPVPRAEHQVTFGTNQNANDVARTLSSQPF